MTAGKWGCVFAAAVAVGPALGVVVSGGTGSTNTNAPAGLAEWNNVGRFNIGEGSAIYLGNRWVLTAWHVKADNNPTQVQLAGTWYGLDVGSWTRLTNASGTYADMVLVRLTNSPPLPDVTLRSSAIPNNASLLMVGNGRLRHPTNSYWDATWTEVYGPPYTYSGFQMFLGHNQKRWGSNTIDNAFKNVDIVYAPYSATTRSFRVTFDDGASADEAQAAIGDSGGAVFYKEGSTWQLAGMMHNINLLGGQPWPSTVVYGDQTWSANLTYGTYHDQLAAAIPEPATVALWLLAGAAAVVASRRARRAAESEYPTG